MAISETTSGWYKPTPTGAVESTVSLLAFFSKDKIPPEEHTGLHAASFADLTQRVEGISAADLDEAIHNRLEELGYIDGNR